MIIIQFFYSGVVHASNFLGSIRNYLTEKDIKMEKKIYKISGFGALN